MKNMLLTIPHPPFRRSRRAVPVLLSVPLLPLLLIAQVGTSAAQPASDTPPAPTTTPRKTEFVRFIFQPPLVSSPMVWARINGSKPLLFVVDTGIAPSTVLFPWVAEEADIDASLYQGQKSGDGDWEQQPIRLGMIHLLPFDDGRPAKEEGIALETFTNVLLLKKDIAALQRVVLPHGKTARVAGFIGSSAFDGSVVTFDFARKRLSVQNRATFTVPHNAVTIALKADDPAHPRTTRWQAPVRIGEKTQWLIVDTGSDSTSVKDTDGAVATGVSVSSNSFMGTHTAALFVTRQVQIGEAVARNVTLKKEVEERPTGLLGTNILSAFTVSLDSGKAELYLEPRTPLPVARERGGMLMRLEKRSGALYVSRLAFGSTAYQAGLREGDKLITIDGYPVEPLMENAALDLITGMVDTRAILIVERDGKRRIFSYQRPYLFDLPK